MTDARLAGGDLEVAYTTTTANRRLGSIFLEVACVAPPTGSTVSFAAAVTASVSTGSPMAAAVSVPVAAAVSCTAVLARAAAVSVPVASGVTAAATLPVATISAVELDGDLAGVTIAGVVGPLPPTPEGTAGIQAALVNSTLAVSPGSIVVKVANGVPGAVATLTVTGNALPATTVVLDDSGAAPGVNVPVSVSSTGTKTLTVSDSSSLVAPRAGRYGLGGSVTTTFDVSAISSPGSFVVPTYTPPAAVQNTTGVVKWVFQDPASSDVYHFPYNPNQMTSPYGTKNIQWTATTAIDGQKLAFEGQQPPVQWQFQGFIRSQAEYDAFVYWQNKRNRIWITDHYGRAWLGYITQFDAVARRTAHIPWSHDYTMHVLLFDGPVTPA